MHSVRYPKRDVTPIVDRDHLGARDFTQRRKGETVSSKRVRSTSLWLSCSCPQRTAVPEAQSSANDSPISSNVFFLVSFLSVSGVTLEPITKTRDLSSAGISRSKSDLRLSHWSWKSMSKTTWAFWLLCNSGDSPGPKFHELRGTFPDNLLSTRGFSRLRNDANYMVTPSVHQP